MKIVVDDAIVPADTGIVAEQAPVDGRDTALDRGCRSHDLRNLSCSLSAVLCEYVWPSKRGRRRVSHQCRQALRGVGVVPARVVVHPATWDSRDKSAFAEAFGIPSSGRCVPMMMLELKTGPFPDRAARVAVKGFVHDGAQLHVRRVARIVPHDDKLLLVAHRQQDAIFDSE